MCAFVHGFPLCVSEGTSLEEQVRRIKDIEAIESDSFVPQAFKSSRDDIKVRSVSLSLRTPHSSSFSPILLLNFPLWIALPSVQRQPRPNQRFSTAPFCSNLRLFHQTLRCSTGSSAAAPTQKPQQAAAVLYLPPHTPTPPPL